MTPRDALQASVPRLLAFADHLAAEGDDALAEAARRAADALERSESRAHDPGTDDHAIDTLAG